MNILSFFAGVILAWIAIVIIQVRNRRRRLRNKKRKRVSLDTYVKLITTVVVVHGIIMSSCSYILSAFGKDPVVEVSVTIISEIVAPVITYLITNTVMNIFEKNKMIFSVPLNSSIVGKDGATHSDSEESAG